MYTDHPSGQKKVAGKKGEVTVIDGLIECV